MLHCEHCNAADVERKTRVRTHYSECWKNHIECANVRIRHLESIAKLVRDALDHKVNTGYEWEVYANSDPIVLTEFYYDHESAILLEKVGFHTKALPLLQKQWAIIRGDLDDEAD